MTSEPTLGTAYDGYEAICARFLAELRDLRSPLGPMMRSTVRATAAFAKRDWPTLEDMAEAPEQTSLSGEQLAEICLQTGLYFGMSDVPLGLRAVHTGLARTGRQLHFAPRPSGKSQDIASQLRARLHGPRKNTGHADQTRPLSSGLYAAFAHVGYGEIWCRGALELRLRLCCALTGLTIAGPTPVLCKFARTALDNDYEIETVRSVLVETSIYHGGPRAFYALMALEENFEDME